MSRSSRWGRGGAMRPVHHEVCRAHINRLGTAPSKEPTWNYEPILPGSAQREFPRSAFMAKRRYTEITWQPIGCRLEKHIVEFKRTIAAGSSSDTNRDTPVTANQVEPSWHGRCITANCRAFHLGKLLKTQSLENYRPTSSVGGPINYNNRTKLAYFCSPPPPCPLG